jgi:hypothetical protein
MQPRHRHDGTMSTILIVDAANVVGSVPDGWWRDRAGAAQRLRDALETVAQHGIANLPGPLTVILVVEGAARNVPSSPDVIVHPARGSGDDAIVDLVRDPAAIGGAPARDAADGAPSAGADTTVVVVTSDRGLRERVTALGATTVGPRSLPYEGRR